MPGFANSYLSKHRLYSTLIKTKPAHNLSGIVIIPCYNEPEVIPTLESLRACYLNSYCIEVIVVINASEKDNEGVLKQNRKTLKEIQQFASLNNDASLQIFPVIFENLPSKNAGAGLARKIGMDEAVHRFNLVNNENGILFSLDADTKVDQNYFVKNFEKYGKYKNTNATTVYFKHHPDNKATQEEKTAIEQYELYLRYYTEALRLTGFPFAFHTIGSCFTVKAETYCKQGGMNQKQAGEDFYFLQKVFPLGNIYEVNDTSVYPSSRFSNRNPFGTGPSLLKIVNAEAELKVYNPQSFKSLSLFFNQIPNLYNSPANIIDIPEPVLHFYTKEKLLKTLHEIATNSTTYATFKQRFFRNFNNFFVVKYLNYCSRNRYKNVLVYEAVTWLLQQKNEESEKNKMLDMLREMQRSKEYRFIPPR